MAVGPRLKVVENENGEWRVVEPKDVGEEKSLWEIHPHDFENVELFNANFIKVLQRGVAIRGTVGWAQDIFQAARLAIALWWRL